MEVVQQKKLFIVYYWLKNNFKMTSYRLRMGDVQQTKFNITVYNEICLLFF